MVFQFAPIIFPRLYKKNGGLGRRAPRRHIDPRAATNTTTHAHDAATHNAAANATTHPPWLA